MHAAPAVSPVAPLNDIPARALATLYEHVGDALLHDKLLCRAQLADSCGTFPTEVFVLSSVVREGLLMPLAAMSHAPHVRATALAQRIQQQLGFRSDVATWAADAWALALGWKNTGTPRSARRGRSRANQNEVGISHPTVHSHPAESKPCSVSLLRSVLHAFRGTVDGLLVCPQVGLGVDNQPISMPCNALVGIITVHGFVPTQRTLGFCEYGIHVVGFKDTATTSPNQFIPYTTLQSSPARVIKRLAVGMGDEARVELGGTTLRAKDLALLLNTVREVVTMRMPGDEEIADSTRRSQ